MIRDISHIPLWAACDMIYHQIIYIHVACPGELTEPTPLITEPARNNERRVWTNSSLSELFLVVSTFH